jgi:hypothetical protein
VIHPTVKKGKMKNLECPPQGSKYVFGNVASGNYIKSLGSTFDVKM